MAKHQVYLGVDVGSVSTNLVLVDPKRLPAESVVKKIYLRTNGAPIETLQAGLARLQSQGQWDILGVGATGSGRELAGTIIGADVVKNEITAHAIAALLHNAQVRTVVEIGGQDSKIIVLRDGVVVDFAMNTVCAAGTGSFLDQQASRLSIPIDQFGPLALQSKNPVRIAGRCTVFAESDMIHKQQLGHAIPDILAGLCLAMVRNYLSNVAKGKAIHPIVLFQGGVAANAGMRRALEEALELPVEVPPYFDVMGAVGVAKLAQEHLESSGQTTRFGGLEIAHSHFTSSSFECPDCSNRCEIVQISRDDSPLACWGSRCGKFSE
ncbi:MAG: 2-hydroxyglutaryl-CoA dehydratase [Firmicutes bacterium]|nr:2-hydroxyglutaryl-CoA dehydratase [Bacillota bacterium]